MGGHGRLRHSDREGRWDSSGAGGAVVNEPTRVKTMRLRYAGVCESCGRAVEKGETAHYLPATRSVRCVLCGPGEQLSVGVSSTLGPTIPRGAIEAGAPIELMQGMSARPGSCGDCGRRIARAAEAVVDQAGMPRLCLDCVVLDTLHVLGVAGGGARREHARRLERHQTKVRTTHPRLGGLILALNEDPSHVRAWQTGAVGEEEFGQALSAMASDAIKVLHDRKVPRSSANIDHIAVTSQTVWLLDTKRYKGRLETRGHGLFSRRPPDLYVGGRNQTKLVTGVHRQIEVVEGVLESFTTSAGCEVPVRGALVFVHAEVGLLTKPFLVDGIWVGWGKPLRRRLTEETGGPLPVPAVAKHLAKELRAG